MIEADDRLVGDPVWELFPASPQASGRRSWGTANYRRWLALAALVIASGLLYPPLAVVTICLAVAIPDLRSGWRLARAIPDKSGGTVCALFTYAWGVWKAAWAAFAS